LNKACGNAMDAHEAAQMHQNFSQQLLQDHIEACSLPEHNLITLPQASPEGAVAVGHDQTGPERSARGRPGAQLPIVRSPATSVHWLVSSLLALSAFESEVIVGLHTEPARLHKLPFDRTVAMAL
ncbi:hypothetical protein STEG23_013299, partial [Scotinomys teguina]